MAGNRDDGAHHLLLIPFAPGIGDTVMMEPLIRAIRRGLPDWRLTVVAREHASDLLCPRGYEFVSPFYYVERAPAPLRPFHRFIPQRLIAWAAEPAMALDLGPFERVVNLFWAWESLIPFNRWWMPQWPLQKGVRHAVDVMADYLEEELGIAIPPAGRVPYLEPFPEGLSWADGYLEAFAGRRSLASLVVSAANPLKWWAASKWAQLNEELSRLGYQTLLVAPPDHPHARQVYEGCTSKPLWPHVGLREITALLGRSDVVVGIDTGPLHVAAALGTSWVGLFGPTNPRVIGPYNGSTGRALVARFPKPASCRSCWRAFKNREGVCPTLESTGCTTLIGVEDVVSAVLSVSPGIPIA